MAEQGASGTSRSKHLQPQPRGTDGSPWDPNVLQGGSCQHTHTVLPTLPILHVSRALAGGEKCSLPREAHTTAV